MKVLVTGAAGHVASLAMPGLSARHVLRLTDLREPAVLPDRAEYLQSNLLLASEAEIGSLFKGIDVVVHSAYIPSGAPDVYSLTPPQIERFETEFDNLRIAQRVYKAALEAGVSRVVMISSNHAADWYEHNEVHQRQRDMIYPDDLPLADNFYGWSKASYELLGYPYACGTFGRQLEVVSLRIGSPYPINATRYEPGAPPQPSSLIRQTGLAGFKRALGAWLSDGDCAMLVRCAVDATNIVAPGKVPWVIAYGISDNTRAFWSLETARRHLGYQPQDDSEIVYAADIQRLLLNAGTSATGRLGAGHAP
jgi:NAD+ dependent glucose-6-phosphate dehydrogenase